MSSRRVTRTSATLIRRPLALTQAQQRHHLLSAVAIPRAGLDRFERDLRVQHLLQRVKIAPRPRREAVLDRRATGSFTGI